MFRKFSFGTTDFFSRIVLVLALVIMPTIGLAESDCTDGIDNDADVLIDCADPSCDAQACDDGLFCNSGETCSAGACGGGVPTICADGVDCTVDVCNEANDSCDFLVDHAACDDGLFCNGVESCNAISDCTAGTAPDCSVFNTQCTTGVCNEDSDACNLQNRPNGAACDDGDRCTPTDTCQVGVCTGSGTSCGNGVLERECGETCEPPGSGTCDATCGGLCGNGVLNVGEACDPPGNDVCDNGADDDDDGLVDCEDPDCCEDASGQSCSSDCSRLLAPCRPIILDPAKIRFRPGALDIFTFHGRIEGSPADFDPASLPFPITLSNSDGVIYSGSLLAGDLQPTRPGGTRFKWVDLSAKTTGGVRDGIAVVKTAFKSRGGVSSYTFRVKIYADFSAADEPLMTYQIGGLNGSAKLTALWEPRSRGWLLRIRDANFGTNVFFTCNTSVTTTSTTTTTLSGGCVDGDGDGYGIGNGCLGDDCNDGDATINPGVPELVGDGIDQDCDGQEACYVDADGDGFGSISTQLSSDFTCSGPGESAVNGDCDDTDPAVNPGATEICTDTIDNECDGQADCTDVDCMLDPSCIDCTDSVQNGDETDVDCGGSCPPCPDGDNCLTDTDCENGFCITVAPPFVCATPNCSDGFVNQDETDVDCGGVTCPGCPGGSACNVDSDCLSGFCIAGICAEPGTCNDGVQNQNETDVDCGGTCGATCLINEVCNAAGDCESGVCTNNQCKCSAGAFIFNFPVSSNGGGATDSAEWPGGTQAMNTPATTECSATIDNPSDNIDLVGNLGDDFSVISFTGFSSCSGNGGEDGDGCSPNSCPFAGIGSCESNRPSCSVALNGSGSANFRVECNP